VKIPTHGGFAQARYICNRDFFFIPDICNRYICNTDICNILGLAGYYCQFIKDFSKHATPLTRLTHKHIVFHWNHLCEHSVRQRQDCLISATILAFPSSDGGYAILFLFWGSGYVVYCDVSSVGVGCVLMQPEFDIYTDHKRLKYIFQ